MGNGEEGWFVAAGGVKFEGATGKYHERQPLLLLLLHATIPSWQTDSSSATQLQCTQQLHVPIIYIYLLDQV
jgi:hypothetical protein